MATILVTDDFEPDRRFVGDILQRDKELSVHYAVDGVDALEQIDKVHPDLVLTDMKMPRLDGLELVRAVRERYAAIPIILMTSQGSDAMAVDALAAGAASYVPKQQLLSGLIETVQHVLALAARKPKDTRLLAEIKKSRAVFVINNDSELIGSLVSHLQEKVEDMGICDETERIRFGVAIEEALVNAMYHGNLEVDSDLKEQSIDEYESLIRTRREESPYESRKIEIQAEISSEEAIIIIGDQGPGFDPSKLPDPTNPQNLEKVSGRGVLLMKTFMDDIRYNETGNQVTMIKRRKAKPQ
ncbi:MAG: ATP-binding protein [Planctomycetales bacterium]